MNRDVKFETMPLDEEDGWRLRLAGDEETRTCSRCGGPLSVIRPAPQPHFASLSCRRCGKFHGWLQTPDGELGQNYVLPYGKHMGKTLDEISAIDRDYLEWVARDFNDEHIRNSVRRYLETRRQDSREFIWQAR